MISLFEQKKFRPVRLIWAALKAVLFGAMFGLILAQAGALVGSAEGARWGWLIGAAIGVLCGPPIALIGKPPEQEGEPKFSEEETLARIKRNFFEGRSFPWAFVFVCAMAGLFLATWLSVVLAAFMWSPWGNLTAFNPTIGAYLLMWSPMSGLAICALLGVIVAAHLRKRMRPPSAQNGG